MVAHYPVYVVKVHQRHIATYHYKLPQTDPIRFNGFRGPQAPTTAFPPRTDRPVLIGPYYGRSFREPPCFSVPSVAPVPLFRVLRVFRPVRVLDVGILMRQRYSWLAKRRDIQDNTYMDYGHNSYGAMFLTYHANPTRQHEMHIAAIIVHRSMQHKE